ncbi:MAG: UvrD-helicase domain-containing protein [Minisyncoccia bacterium]
MLNYTKSYQELNPQQKQAVDTLIGPVMVVAGPGSGKTQLLSLRVVNILNTQDVLPENIICLTFTDAAAYNMRQRLASFIGKQAYKVNIHTFHSFGQSLLKDYTEYTAGIERSAIDDIVIAEIIGDIIATLPYNHILIPKGADRSKLIRNISQSIKYLKQAGLTPTEYIQVLEQNQKAYNDIIPIIQKISNISLNGNKDRVDKLNQIRILAESIPLYNTDNSSSKVMSKITKNIIRGFARN